MKLTPVDAPLIRKDTSVGTRIFVGDTMIYGDTGWMSFPTSDPTVTVYMCRVNEKVYARVVATSFSAGGTVRLCDVPSFLRPAVVERLLYSEQSGIAPSKLLVVFSGANAWMELRSKTAGEALYFTVEWFTESPWPTSLTF